MKRVGKHELIHFKTVTPLAPHPAHVSTPNSKALIPFGFFPIVPLSLHALRMAAMVSCWSTTCPAHGSLTLHDARVVASITAIGAVAVTGLRALATLPMMSTNGPLPWVRIRDHGRTLWRKGEEVGVHDGW